jgi:branched-subunit amino acid aminotransferase/4-amino-4-deoxychorismate lyase
VLTAGEADGVLPGIMRIYVLRACAALSIPVVQQAPHWSSHATWREAFLTNRCGLMIGQVM